MLGIGCIGKWIVLASRSVQSGKLEKRTNKLERKVTSWQTGIQVLLSLSIRNALFGYVWKLSTEEPQWSGDLIRITDPLETMPPVVHHSCTIFWKCQCFLPTDFVTSTRTPRGHLAMSETFLVVTAVKSMHLVGRGQQHTKHCAMYRTAPCNKELSTHPKSQKCWRWEALFILKVMQICILLNVENNTILYFLFFLFFFFFFWVNLPLQKNGIMFHRCPGLGSGPGQSIHHTLKSMVLSLAPHWFHGSPHLFWKMAQKLVTKCCQIRQVKNTGCPD